MAAEKSWPDPFLAAMLDHGGWENSSWWGGPSTGGDSRPWKDDEQTEEKDEKDEKDEMMKPWDCRSWKDRDTCGTKTSSWCQKSSTGWGCRPWKDGDTCGTKKSSWCQKSSTGWDCGPWKDEERSEEKDEKDEKDEKIPAWRRAEWESCGIKNSSLCQKSSTGGDCRPTENEVQSTLLNMFERMVARHEHMLQQLSHLTERMQTLEAAVVAAAQKPPSSSGDDFTITSPQQPPFSSSVEGQLLALAKKGCWHGPPNQFQVVGSWGDSFQMQWDPDEFWSWESHFLGMMNSDMTYVKTVVKVIKKMRKLYPNMMSMRYCMSKGRTTRFLSVKCERCCEVGALNYSEWHKTEDRHAYERQKMSFALFMKLEQRGWNPEKPEH